MAGGADVTAMDRYGGTVLRWAKFDGQWDVVNRRIAHGTDVTAKRNDGGTVLHKAPSAGQCDVAKWLVIEQGADVNAQDQGENRGLDLGGKEDDRDDRWWIQWGSEEEGERKREGLKKRKRITGTGMTSDDDDHY